MKFSDTYLQRRTTAQVKVKASPYVITDVEGRRLCVANRMCDLLSFSKNCGTGGSNALQALLPSVGKLPFR